VKEFVEAAAAESTVPSTVGRPAVGAGEASPQEATTKSASVPKTLGRTVFMPGV